MTKTKPEVEHHKEEPKPPLEIHHVHEHDGFHGVGGQEADFHGDGNAGFHHVGHVAAGFHGNGHGIHGDGIGIHDGEFGHGVGLLIQSAIPRCQASTDGGMKCCMETTASSRGRGEGLQSVTKTSFLMFSR